MFDGKLGYPIFAYNLCVGFPSIGPGAESQLGAHPNSRSTSPSQEIHSEEHPDRHDLVPYHGPYNADGLGSKSRLSSNRTGLILCEETVTKIIPLADPLPLLCLS